MLGNTSQRCRRRLARRWVFISALSCKLLSLILHQPAPIPNWTQLMARAFLVAFSRRLIKPVKLLVKFDNEAVQIFQLAHFVPPPHKPRNALTQPNCRSIPILGNQCVSISPAMRKSACHLVSKVNIEDKQSCPRGILRSTSLFTRNCEIAKLAVVKTEISAANDISARAVSNSMHGRSLKHSAPIAGGHATQEHAPPGCNTTVC